MSAVGEHAIVLGASLSGLFAARVLADFYETVTVIERDHLPDKPIERKGVPQARHGHFLLSLGCEIADELFPGLLDEWEQDGAPVWRDGEFSKALMSFGGHTVVRTGRANAPIRAYYPSRPLLEWRVRRHVTALPNVRILDGLDLTEFTTSPGTNRITGVRCAARDTDVGNELAADLVVDAMGRGSRTPALLANLGHDGPPVDELTVQLNYTSQWLRLAPGTLTEHHAVILPEPGRLTTFALIGNEDDRWLLTVGTMVDMTPARDRAEMLEIAEKAAPAKFFNAVREAEPIGEVHHHRVPSNRWRRYDKLPQMPAGLLVTGDALCSFNPIYGQGMTMAAVDAMVLRDCLRGGTQSLSRRYFTQCTKKIRLAWQSSVGSDLALPEVDGPRPVSMRLTNAFTKRILIACSTDPVVAGMFVRVMGMLEPPTKLMHPTMLARIAAANLRKPVSQPQVRVPARAE